MLLMPNTCASTGCEKKVIICHKIASTKKYFCDEHKNLLRMHKWYTFSLTSHHSSSILHRKIENSFFFQKVTLRTQLIYRWGDAKIHWICTWNKRFSLLLTFFKKESHRWVSYRSCICLSFYPVELQRCLYNTQNANKYYGLHFHLSSHHGISHKIHISSFFFWWNYHWHSHHTVWSLL